MSIVATSMTKKGQVTIPVEVRRLLGLRPRDRVIFEIGENQVTIRPAHSDLLAKFGTVKPRRTPEDFEELRDSAKDWLAGENQRELADG